jgi:preprotein translocase subunit YajC
MTTTILLLIVMFAIVLSVFAIYFYDKKLMKEIEEYEERMKNKGYFKRHFIKDKK